MVTKVVAILTVFLYLFGAGCLALENQNIEAPTDILSQEEIDWLAEHPTIRLAFPSNLPPYSQLDSNGKPIGFIHDFYAILNAKIGSNITIVPHDVGELDGGLSKGLYDGIAGITYSTKSKGDYVYTNEIVSAKWSVFTQRDAISYSNFSQISSETIAILSGDTVEPILRAHYPNIEIIKYSSILSALLDVEQGKVFAVFGESRVLKQVVKINRIYGVNENFVAHQLDIHTGSKIRKDWTILGEIINKAQASIPDYRHKLLMRKWLQSGVDLSHLTLDEIQWLQQRQSVNINFFELPPYIMAGEDKVDGFLPDYFSLFEGVLGIEFKFNLVSVEQFPYNADGTLPEASFTLDGTKFQNSFEFTKPFFTSSFGHFTLVDRNKLSNQNELNDHVTGVMDRTINRVKDGFLKEKNKFNIKVYSDLSMMVNDLLLGKVDSVYAEISSLQSYLSRNMINAVVLNWLDTKFMEPQSMAIRKDLKPLVNILSKSWSKINKNSQARFFDKWLISDSSKISNARPLDGENGENGENGEKSYTLKQKRWISLHPQVYYSDVSWIPYIEVENGVSGIGKDYLDIIAKDSGITFTYVPSINWAQVIKKLRDNEIALTLAAGKSTDRTEFAIFSEPYISSAMSIVTSDKYSYVQNLKQLEGLTIAIPKGFFLSDYITKNHPKIKLIFTVDILQALTLVAENKADAFIGSMASVASYLRKGELYNLRVSGLINQQLSVHFMIGKNHPELREIINKTLKSIDDVERRVIANRWFAINYHTGIQAKTVWFILLAAGIIVAISAYWIRRLKVEIYQKVLVQKALKSARVDADRANKAKSEFLANMSHEIRTPMNAIVGFSQLLSESGLTEKQQSYLSSIRVGSDGLLHIINDILDLSKIEAGKLQIEYTSTDLVNMINELKLLFSRSMKNKGISFTTEIMKNVPRYLLLDSNRVRQILINIIGNAQKFTDFGKIKVKVTIEKLPEDLKVRNLLFEVQDSGIGIESKSLERVFRNFEQHEDVTNSKYGGTGLGLAISRKLANEMNGQLTAISEIGIGSCFTLKLNNVELGEELANPVKEKFTYQFKKSVILVVDDIESNRILLTKYLEPYPFEVFIAEDGEIAVDLATKTKPDLVLMDLRMPKMDGYQATQLIKKQLDTVVIALTASALEDEESKQKQQIFDAFLRKPILKSKLISVIAEFLGHQTSLIEGNDKQQYQLLISPQQSTFAAYIKNEILVKIKDVHKKGDVTKLALLAESLQEKSKQSNHLGWAKFSADLAVSCEAFDVDKIDYLIKLLLLEFECSEMYG